MSSKRKVVAAEAKVSNSDIIWARGHNVTYERKFGKATPFMEYSIQLAVQMRQNGLSRQLENCRIIMPK